MVIFNMNLSQLIAMYNSGTHIITNCWYTWLLLRELRCHIQDLQRLRTKIDPSFVKTCEMHSQVIAPLEVALEELEESFEIMRCGVLEDVIDTVTDAFRKSQFF